MTLAQAAQETTPITTRMAIAAKLLSPHSPTDAATAARMTTAAACPVAPESASTDSYVARFSVAAPRSRPATVCDGVSLIYGWTQVYRRQWTTWHAPIVRSC